MDTAYRTDEKTAEPAAEQTNAYDPAVQEGEMEGDVHELMSYLVAESERTEKPVSIHAITDRAHFRETLKSGLEHYAPPKFAKAIDHLCDRLEDLAERVYADGHSTALCRLVLNIGANPIVDRLTPYAPAAYSLGNLNNHRVRERVALANDIWGIDPELHIVPPGFVFIYQPTEPPPTDRQEAVNKPGRNPWMSNEKDSSEETEENTHTRFGGIPPEDVESVGLAEKVAEGVVAETWLERQNRENREFLKRRETENFLEDKRRETEQFYEKQREEEKRRIEKERQDRAHIERQAANEGLAAIIALEAALGRIRSNAGPISHGRNLSVMEGIGGLIGAVRGFVGLGLGGENLLARASGDLGIANEQIGEIRRLHQEASAELAAKTAEGGTPETRPEQANAAGTGPSADRQRASTEAAELAAAQSAIAAAETELALVRAGEASEQGYAQEYPNVAALRAAEALLAQIPGDSPLAARIGADIARANEELSEVMQAARERKPGAAEAALPKAPEVAAEISGRPAPARAEIAPVVGAQAAAVGGVPERVAAAGTVPGRIEAAAESISEPKVTAAGEVVLPAQGEALRVEEMREAAAPFREDIAPQATAGATGQPATASEQEPQVERQERAGGPPLEAAEFIQPSQQTPELGPAQQQAHEQMTEAFKESVAETATGGGTQPESARVEPQQTAAATQQEPQADRDQGGGGLSPEAAEFVQPSQQTPEPGPAQQQVQGQMTEAVKEDVAETLHGGGTQPESANAPPQRPAEPPEVSAQDTTPEDGGHHPLRDEVAEHLAAGTAGAAGTSAAAAQTPQAVAPESNEARGGAAGSPVEAAEFVQPSQQTQQPGPAQQQAREQMTEAVKDDVAETLHGGGTQPESARAQPQQPAQPPPETSGQDTTPEDGAHHVLREEVAEHIAAQAAGAAGVSGAAAAAEQKPPPPEATVEKAAEAAVRDDQASRQAAEKVSEEAQMDQALQSDERPETREPPSAKQPNENETATRQPPGAENQPQQPSERPDKGIGETVKKHVAEHIAAAAFAVPRDHAAPAEQPASPPPEPPPASPPQQTVNSDRAAPAGNAGAGAAAAANIKQPFAPVRKSTVKARGAKVRSRVAPQPVKKATPAAKAKAAPAAKAKTAQRTPPPAQKRAPQARPAQKASPRQAPVKKSPPQQSVNRNPGMRQQRNYKELPQPPNHALPEPEPK